MANTILLKGRGIRKEAVGSGTITPVDLLNITSAGLLIRHGSASLKAAPLFAVENDLIGNEITDDSASGDYVQADGSKLMLKTTVAEIVVGGNNAEFRIMPCVNSRDHGQGAHAAGGSDPSANGANPYMSDDDMSGPTFPSEASGMDGVPF